MPFGKLKRRKKTSRNTQLNYVRREGPKLNKAPFKHNESQNAIIYDVSRTCEKRNNSKLNIATNTNNNQGVIPADPCINKFLSITNTRICIGYQFLIPMYTKTHVVQNQ